MCVESCLFARIFIFEIFYNYFDVSRGVFDRQGARKMLMLILIWILIFTRINILKTWYLENGKNMPKQNLVTFRREAVLWNVFILFSNCSHSILELGTFNYLVLKKIFQKYEKIFRIFFLYVILLYMNISITTYIFCVHIFLHLFIHIKNNKKRENSIACSHLSSWQERLWNKILAAHFRTNNHLI